MSASNPPSPTPSPTPFPTPATSSKAFSDLLAQVAIKAAAAAVFGTIETKPNRLSCQAIASAEPAFYRLLADASHLWVALVTDNRWLSGSIEQQLTHTGDKLPDLLEEEFADLDMPGTRPAVEHFRDEAKFFTFRSKVLSLADAETEMQLNPLAVVTKVATYLLAYEMCFRRLGDMEVSGEDE